MALFLVRELPEKLPSSALVCHALSELTEEQLNNGDNAVYLLRDGGRAATERLSLAADDFLAGKRRLKARGSGSGTAGEAVLSYGRSASDLDFDFDFGMQDLNFPDMCRWWLEKKEISVREFYRRANITRGSFYHITHTDCYVPKKATAFACVIGLGLDCEQAEDLLNRAGLAFSPYYDLDVIVKGFVQKGYYDIHCINEVLFDKDLQLLGSA